MKRANYDKEMAEARELLGQGFKMRDVAEIIGIPYGTISVRFSRERAKARKEAVAAAATGVKEAKPEVKEKTLGDFDPRDLMKYLYSLGYRIDEKGIYVMVKQYVNIKSIINE